MAIIRYTDPFRDLATVQERMNRLFEDFLGRGAGHEEGFAPSAWSPAVDIYETDDAVVVKAELPGVTRDQVDVEVKDGVLTLRGERKAEQEVRGENYHRMERAYGAFMRSFSLPRGVDDEKINPKLKDGILEISLPKKAEVKPKQIKVAA